MRAGMIAIALITLSLGMNIFNEFNDCYCGANCKVYYCGNYSTTSLDFSKSAGHRLVDIRIEPLIPNNQIIVDQSGKYINASNQDEYKNMTNSLLEYKTPNQGILDQLMLFGFFLGTAVKIIINTLFLPIAGLPSFMIYTIGIPNLVVYPICSLIMLTMILDVVFLISGRSW